MSRLNESLFNRNADACETARHPKCVCACAGALHGARHSATWRSETYGRVKDYAAELDRAANPDLFERQPVRP